MKNIDINGIIAYFIKSKKDHCTKDCPHDNASLFLLIYSSASVFGTHSTVHPLVGLVGVTVLAKRTWILHPRPHPALHSNS